MSKGSLSFNLKAKKSCDADGMILHCVNLKARQKSDNVQYPENTHLNISSPNLHQNYKDVTDRIETLKNKKIQKNANHYLEGVLAFGREDYEKDPEGFREKAPALIEKYMNDIADKYGFEPLGYSLHFDEGHTNEETGKQELNVHAHISFVNYDFEQNKSRFREIQKKYVSNRKYPNEHFVKMQDMAFDCFKELGFKRGVSKQISKDKHLEKVDYVEKKLNEAIEKIDKLENKSSKLEKQNEILELSNKKQKEDFSNSLKTNTNLTDLEIKKVIKNTEKKQNSFNTYVDNKLNNLITNFNFERQEVDNENYDDSTILATLKNTFVSPTRLETEEEVNNRLVKELVETSLFNDRTELEKQIIIEKAQSKKFKDFLSKNSTKSKLVSNNSKEYLENKIEELKLNHERDIAILKAKNKNSVSKSEHQKSLDSNKKLIEENRVLSLENSNLKAKLRQIGNFIIYMTEKFKNVFVEELANERTNPSDNLIVNSAMSFKKEEPQHEKLFEIDKEVDTARQQLEIKNNNDIEEPKNIKKYDKNGNEVFKCGGCSTEIKRPGLCLTCKGSSGGSNYKI